MSNSVTQLYLSTCVMYGKRKYIFFFIGYFNLSVTVRIMSICEGSVVKSVV